MSEPTAIERLLDLLPGSLAIERDILDALHEVQQEAASDALRRAIHEADRADKAEATLAECVMNVASIETARRQVGLDALHEEQALADKLAASAKDYIAYRDRRLRLWKAVVDCGHEAGSDCPEFRAVQADGDVNEDERLDDAIRAALAAYDEARK